MASTDPPENQHRIKVRILVVFASILAFLAIFTSWIDRQALNTDRWVDTSGKLLEDKTISDAVASYTVDQLYANVDVSAVIKQRLPKDVQQFSAPLAAGVRQFATRAAEQAIQSPRIQQAWKDANRIAHTQLVSILKGNNEVVSSQNGKVVLNLRPLVLQLADRIGLKKQLNQKLPPDVGQLEIADSKDLDTARTVTKLIEGFAWFFTFGSVACFGLAVYLAKGRRWMVLLAYGLGLMAAGLGAIAVRGALKGLFVDSLANTEAANEPAKHAWDIGTSLLHSIAITVIIYGVLFVLAAFLASPSGYAVGVRRALAPTLRDRRERRLVDLRRGGPDRVDRVAARWVPPAGADPAVDRPRGGRHRGAQAKDARRVPRRTARGLDAVDAGARPACDLRDRPADRVGGQGPLGRGEGSRRREARPARAAR